MDYWNGVFSELTSRKVICSVHIFYYHYYFFIVVAAVLVTFYVAAVLVAKVLLINVLINCQTLFPSIKYRITRKQQTGVYFYNQVPFDTFMLR